MRVEGLRCNLGAAKFYLLFDSAPFAAAADEEENDVRFSPKLVRGCKQRIERVAGTMVAGIHYDKFSLEVVSFTKAFPAHGIELNFAVMGPGWKNGDFVG